MLFFKAPPNTNYASRSQYNEGFDAGMVQSDGRIKKKYYLKTNKDSFYCYYFRTRLLRRRKIWNST